jgi:hypothetical protein
MVTLWAVGQAVVAPVVVQTDSGDGGGGGGGGGGVLELLPPPPQEMMEKASAQATATLSKFFIFETRLSAENLFIPRNFGWISRFYAREGQLSIEVSNLPRSEGNQARKPEDDVPTGGNRLTLCGGEDR